MENNHFHPIAGQIYQNHNGIKYLCLESEGFSSDGLFISVSSGYVLLAHCALPEKTDKNRRQKTE